MRSRSIKPDGAEITRLFEAHSDELLGFFARRTFDSQVAFDLLGETFAAAFEARAKCRARSASELHGWLFGIARNQLNLFYREGFIERRALIEVVDRVRSFLSDESYERVERSRISRLPARDWPERSPNLAPSIVRCCQLRVVEERSYCEVAEQLAGERAGRACACQPRAEESACWRSINPTWKEHLTMHDGNGDRNSIPELAKLRVRTRAASFERAERSTPLIRRSSGRAVAGSAVSSGGSRGNQRCLCDRDIRWRRRRRLTCADYDEAGTGRGRTVVA